MQQTDEKKIKKCFCVEKNCDIKKHFIKALHFKDSQEMRECNKFIIENNVIIDAKNIFEDVYNFWCRETIEEERMINHASVSLFDFEDLNKSQLNELKNKHEHMYETKNGLTLFKI